MQCAQPHCARVHTTGLHHGSVGCRVLRTLTRLAGFAGAQARCPCRLHVASLVAQRTLQPVAVLTAGAAWDRQFHYIHVRRNQRVGAMHSMQVVRVPIVHSCAGVAVRGCMHARRLSLCVRAPHGVQPFHAASHLGRLPSSHMSVQAHTYTQHIMAWERRSAKHACDGLGIRSLLHGAATGVDTCGISTCKE